MIVTDVSFFLFFLFFALLCSSSVPPATRTDPIVAPLQHNYGEGSAREHASLQPRFLNCKVILACVYLDYLVWY